MPNAISPAFRTAATLPLWIVCSTLTIIIVAMVAALLIRSIASQALNRAEPKDIADVIMALSRMLDAFHGFLPSRGSSSPNRKQTAENSKVTSSSPSASGEQ